MAYYSECSFLSINMPTHINSKLAECCWEKVGLLTCIFFCVCLLEQILYLSLNYVTELNLKYHFATALMFSLTKSKVITTYFQCRKSFYWDLIEILRTLFVKLQLAIKYLLNLSVWSCIFAAYACTGVFWMVHISHPTLILLRFRWGLTISQ